MLITSFTQKIEWLANQSRLFYLGTALYYKSIIKREVELARIGSKDNILCIGGGPCPYTAIMLHQLTSAPVTVIDNNKKCVEQSANLIKRLNLEKSIRIIYSDGVAINCAGFTVIHLALQISPKGKVLNRLLERAEKGAKILVRMPKKCINGLYCGMESCSSSCYAHVVHNFFTNIKNTVLYVKGELYSEANA
jgi:16S rRNA A1518/A1519 N6-dimethyltransferase RsmA/KsgA/DIM1 with predicted DNA glycosylase/AP lyase activity